MLDQITGRLAGSAAEIAADRDVPVLQRLTGMMLALNMTGSLGREIMEQVHKPQHALKHQKMREQLLREITPIVADLRSDRRGRSTGVCRTDYPVEAAEMTLLYFKNLYLTR